MSTTTIERPKSVSFDMGSDVTIELSTGVNVATERVGYLSHENDDYDGYSYATSTLTREKAVELIDALTGLVEFYDQEAAKPQPITEAKVGEILVVTGGEEGGIGHKIPVGSLVKVLSASGDTARVTRNVNMTTPEYGFDKDEYTNRNVRLVYLARV